MTAMHESNGSYPRTEETRQGLPVDAGITSLVEQSIDLGLTPRSSCSGLDCDHAPDTTATPYLSIQVAPTFEAARPTTTLPAEHVEATLLQRLRRVGDRAGWLVEDGVTWLLYPSATFRLVPTRGGVKNRLFGRDREYDDLSADEEARLDRTYDEARADGSALTDDEISEQWEALGRELAREFEDDDLPQFEDNRAGYEMAQELLPEVFDLFFDSDAELLKFYD